MDRSYNLVKTKEIIGSIVKNNKKEKLGHIEEIILHKTAGNICYVVLSCSTFLGFEDNYLPLPWNALRYDNSQDCFIINIPSERLKNAPHFAKDHWPDWTDRNFGEVIYHFYGTRPYWVELDN